MIDIIPPLTPRGEGWVEISALSPVVSLTGYPTRAFAHILGTRIFVLSAVEVAKDKDGIDRGPEYHVSISRDQKRIDSEGAKWVLAQFGLDGAEEDNHVHGGFVRNFWRPVADRFVGLECACKGEEPAVVEDKGDFVWRP